MMMQKADIKNIFFLGIGGAGMSALARFFHRKGIAVSGYDKRCTPLTEKLEDEGINVLYSDNPEQLPPAIDKVVYTPAVPADLAVWKELQQRQIPFVKRAGLLGELSRDYLTVAVAGTHGKTTVSTLIAWLLHHSNMGTNAILGGISSNWDDNVLLHPVSRFLVTEADEYDRSFLHLQPKIAVITSLDRDHLDVYGQEDALRSSFEAFAGNIQAGGFLLVRKGVKLKAFPKGVRKFKYALDEESDFYASRIRLQGMHYHFDFHSPWGKIENLQLGMPGWINVENAVAALAVAVLLNLEKAEVAAALPSFAGNKRRFDIFARGGKTYIDDYAHHPREIESLLTSVRKLFPKQKLIGVFQPHLYTRTRDFAREFAASLDLLDQLILLPVYPAREQAIEGVDASLIASYLPHKEKCEMVDKEDVVDYLRNVDFDVLLTMGAGDIDTITEDCKMLIEEKALKGGGENR